MTATIARVVDLETTGTPEDEAAEIIEFGRYDVDLSTMQIGDAWDTLIRPRGVIPPETKAVHHITEEDVADAPEARDVWGEFFSGLDDDAIMVAHNAKFEMFFLGESGKRYRWIDTYKVARIVWPDAPSHSNQCLRYWLTPTMEINPKLAFPPHRALPDAYVTAHILRRLLAYKTVAQMIEITKYPALLKVMNFGKHKGTTFENAPVDYLEWIRDKSSLDEDTKFSAKYWLQKRRGAE